MVGGWRSVPLPPGKRKGDGRDGKGPVPVAETRRRPVRQGALMIERYAVSRAIGFEIVCIGAAGRCGLRVTYVLAMTHCALLATYRRHGAKSPSPLSTSLCQSRLPPRIGTLHVTWAISGKLDPVLTLRRNCSKARSLRARARVCAWRPRCRMRPVHEASNRP